MRVCVSSKIIVLLIGFSAAILVGAGSAKADFTFGTPTNLGPVVNSSANEHPGGITADGLSLYFSSRGAGGTTEWYDIYVSSRPTIYDPWGEPVKLGPNINTWMSEFELDILPDELALVFVCRWAGTVGDWDLWMTTRATTDDTWPKAVNLGSTVNSSVRDMDPSISADGLTLYFNSDRPGGYGAMDILVTTRPTINDPWSEAVNLGPPINGSTSDYGPEISADGRTLFFNSRRPGGLGDTDFYVTRRPTKNDPWGAPVNLGAGVNSQGSEDYSALSADERLLLFSSNRSGGQGGSDIWQVPIIPIVDFNGDGIVDSADMCIMVDHWGMNEPLCDIGPTPLGDGIVDVQDMIVLAEHLFMEMYDPDPDHVALWKMDETVGNIAHDSFRVYDGICHGEPVWQPDSGVVGGALQLDGFDDYVITNSVLDPADGAFSVFAWVQGGIPGQVIISQSDGSGTGNTWLGLDAESGTLMTGLVPPSAGWVAENPLVSESIISDGQWHHVGFVWDGSYRILYSDGIEIAKDAAAQNPLKSANGGLHIGAGKSLSAGTFFSGLIDDVRIYNIALSAEEIAALAQ